MVLLQTLQETLHSFIHLLKMGDELFMPMNVIYYGCKIIGYLLVDFHLLVHVSIALPVFTHVPRKH